MVVALSLLGLAYYLLGIYFIPQFTLKFDKRAWVDVNFSHLTPPPPLHVAQCFDVGRIERETMYNWTEAQVLPRRRMVNAGTGMNVDMGCYEAAKLVQPIDPDVGYAYPTSGWIPIGDAAGEDERHRQAKALLSKDLTYDDRHIPPQHRVLTYHTYWRTDLLPFSDRQAFTLRAFLATQPLSTSRVVIWSNSAATLATAAPLASLIAKFPNNIQIRQVDFTSLTSGTALEGNAIFDERRAGLYDGKGWIDGDAVRLLVLYQYGGVWMDMDQVLTRDLRPLIEHEFVSQWDCEGARLCRCGVIPLANLLSDKPYLRFNGALMHFRKHSPYLCEAFHIMSSLPPPRPNSLNWGAHLYHHLHRRLLHGGQTPFAILPWCFTDPQNCRKDIAIPSPFVSDLKVWRGRPWTDGAREELEGRIGSVFSVHLHNQWTKSIPEHGWLDRLVRAQDEQVRVLELYQRWVGRKC